MARYVGTLKWAEESRGRLSASDRVELWGQAVRLQGRLTASLARRLLRLRPRIVANLDDAPYREPDSAAAKRAAQLCRNASPRHLVNHCRRSYLWGCILSEATGLRIDPELFYVACMLHDLGFTEAYRGRVADAHCFTLDSAIAAEDLAEIDGWTSQQSDAVAEAILLHMNVQVDLEHGDESFLLHESTAFDVLGLRAWEVSAETRSAVVERAPRANMKAELGAAMKADGRARPCCRLAFLQRYFLFNPMLQRAPFPE